VATQFDCTQPAISHHLRVLREAGLVRSRVDAQRRLYALEPAGLDVIETWLSTQRQFWKQQLDRLAAQIDRDLAVGTLPATERSATEGSFSEGDDE
jgi:DNA-binding transcriptional ArsR family regulator